MTPEQRARTDERDRLLGVVRQKQIPADDNDYRHDGLAHHDGGVAGRWQAPDTDEAKAAYFLPHLGLVLQVLTAAPHTESRDHLESAEPAFGIRPRTCRAPPTLFDAKRVHGHGGADGTVDSRTGRAMPPGIRE